ncbi:MAG: hypothetical protein AAFN74_20935 [Myxococcota bacterium]
MSLLKRDGHDPKVDEAVKKALSAYGRAEPEARADVVHRLAVRMTADQRRQFAARLAEVSLGQLWVLLDEEP